MEKDYLPIKTKMLLVNEFSKDDKAELSFIYNSQENQLYNGPEYYNYSESDIIEKLDHLCSQDYFCFAGRLVYAVCIAETGELAGYFGLKNGTLDEHGSVEVLYSISKKHWNKGYGTEVLKGMIHFCFKNFKLHRIFSGCDIDNAASIRIMEKAGMRFESRWRKDRMRNSKWTDGLGFAILDEDINVKYL